MRIITTTYRHAPSLPSGLAWRLSRLGVALLLFGWILSLSVAYDFGMSDESWYLQVLTRVVSGDVLYRDVFWGTTPLSVYLAAPLVALFGSEIVVVKAFVSSCFVLTALFCGTIVQRLGTDRWSAGFLVLALLAYGWPRQSAGYTPLAYACLLGCLHATLEWRVRTGADPCKSNAFEQLALAGGWAGLCFASKQNVGACAFAALTATVLLTLLERRSCWRTAWRAMLVLGAACAAVVFVTLVPVVLSRGSAQFLDFGFTNKRTYLRTGGISYLDGLRELARGVQTLQSIGDLRLVYLQTIFVLPPVALVTLLFAWLASPEYRGQLGAVGLFAGAACLGIYPRADLDHVIYAVPTVLLSLIYAGSRLAGRVPRVIQHLLRIGLASWFVLGIGLLASGALGRVLSPDYEQSTLPHFRGVWLSKHEHATHHRFAQELQIATAGEQPFLLGSYAAFSYLVAGLENPTPFDYPLETAFGLHGAQRLMTAIEQGRMRSICMTRDVGLAFTPHELRNVVTAHMEPITDLEFCTVYRWRSPEHR